MALGEVAGAGVELADAQRRGPGLLPDFGEEAVMNVIRRLLTGVVLVLWIGTIIDPAGGRGQQTHAPAMAFYALGIVTVVVITWWLVRWSRIGWPTKKDFHEVLWGRRK